VHPLIHGDRGWFAGRTHLPVLPGTLAHVTVERLPDGRDPHRAMWLWHVDGLPGREVRRHRPPADALLDQVADAVDDIAAAVPGRAPAPALLPAGEGKAGSVTAHSASLMSDG
jgi:hypothetical protein